VQAKTGSNKEVNDDVTKSRDSRARRPRIYDWNTKQHFYPDIIDSDDWTSQFVRWGSARWRSGHHQAASSGSSGSSGSAVQPVSGTVTAVVCEQPEKRSVASPFRR